MRNLVLSKHRSKHRSAGTFVDFSLQSEFKHEDWYRAKRMMYWKGNKICFAWESLLWALVLDVCQRQPKSHFSWRVTRKGDFLSPRRDRQLDTSWYQLILVNTGWYWVDTRLIWTSTQQVVGALVAGIGTDTLCIIVTIVSVYLALINFTSS